MQEQVKQNMKVNEIIKQCEELLEDKDYYLETIELTKEEIKILIKEIEKIKKTKEYLEYQLTQFDFEKDIKARMLCAMTLILLGDD